VASTDEESSLDQQSDAELRKKHDGGVVSSKDGGVKVGSVDGGVPLAVGFAQVQAIFDAHCVSCHQEGVLRGGLSLTAGDSYAQLVNVSAAGFACASFGQRVLPFNVGASLLSQKVHGTQQCGARMPASDSRIGVAPLTQQELDVIDGWISTGATAR
jgi:hypothetical protein